MYKLLELLHFLTFLHHLCFTNGQSGTNAAKENDQFYFDRDSQVLRLGPAGWLFGAIYHYNKSHNWDI